MEKDYVLGLIVRDRLGDKVGDLEGIWLTRGETKRFIEAHGVGWLYFCRTNLISGRYFSKVANGVNGYDATKVASWVESARFTAKWHHKAGY